MPNLIRQERVYEELTKALVETLRAKPENVKPESSLVKDLGAESLDFLDIDYRVEQAFGIKMARHFFIEHVEEMFGEGAAIDPDGRLTEPALTLLKSRYGEENLPDLSAGLEMDQLSGLITVRSMADAVTSILATLPEACACGASAWKADDGAHVTCGACGAAAAYTNGDDLIQQWLTRVQAETGLFKA
jgi:acyl carrier protein